MGTGMSMFVVRVLRWKAPSSLGDLTMHKRFNFVT